MNKIRILPEILSNQIAAGEVVQRPASVVKELVENSMDAGADRITIEIEKGGRSLIRISDNGVGLVRDQAMLAVERYATSKIFSKDDLFSIATFGFRGEALPSIASVSKFTLVSRPKTQESGTRIDIDGGKLKKVADAGAPPGTMVEVRQLFFNTPARRKFLKAESTETSHISDAVSGLAMGNPDIGFRLFLNKKLVRNYPPGQDLAQRARMVLGKDAADHLYPLNIDEGEIKITGVCANPAVTRSTPNRIYLFVNHRLVHDRGMVAALFQGYRGRIMKGRYPMGVISVELPFEQVDVNVHPTKREIKFLMPQPVYRLLGRAVETLLADAQTDAIAYARSGPVSFVGGFGSPKASESTAAGPEASEPVTGKRSIGKVVYGKTDSHEPKAQQVAQGEIKWSGVVPVKSSAPASSLGVTVERGSPKIDSNENASDVSQTSQALEPTEEVVFPEPEGQLPEAKGQDLSATRIVGQVLGTYIVLEREG
ncbi:MAG: DNA mismatch repair endonuclease MutL, partial [Desulfobacterales bacterium]|nr:DNA mismatch repair endonuclease MutL [Desulfobacterales bacterium]